MYTLFISTFDKYIHIGLLKDDQVIKFEKKESLQSHSIYTVPMIEDILKENNITVKDLSLIEVINGPGSFTGVRIGVTIAKTLAYTLSIPIKVLTSLEAYAVSTEKEDIVVTTIKDIKGVYFGIFDKNNNLLEPLKYLNNNEFKNYLKEKSLEDKIVESKLNLEKIHKYLKTKKETNAHKVNPIYIKLIEVEKC